MQQRSHSAWLSRASLPTIAAVLLAVIGLAGSVWRRTIGLRQSTRRVPPRARTSHLVISPSTLLPTERPTWQAVGTDAGIKQPPGSRGPADQDEGRKSGERPDLPHQP